VSRVFGVIVKPSLVEEIRTTQQMARVSGSHDTSKVFDIDHVRNLTRIAKTHNGALNPSCLALAEVQGPGPLGATHRMIL